MGRLIDADVVENMLRDCANNARKRNDNESPLGLNQAVLMLRNVPTAYDVGKVVGQIHDSFEGYLDEIIDNPEKLDKVDFLLKQNKEICNLVRNGGKE